MNYPKPDILKNLPLPGSASKPSYSFVPQYTGSFELTLPKQGTLSKAEREFWFLDDVDETETTDRPRFLTNKVVVVLIMVAIGLLIPFVLMHLKNRRR